jgi:hypothetical protein
VYTLLYLGCISCCIQDVYAVVSMMYNEYAVVSRMYNEYAVVSRVFMLLYICMRYIQLYLGSI